MKITELKLTLVDVFICSWLHEYFANITKYKYTRMCLQEQIAKYSTCQYFMAYNKCWKSVRLPEDPLCPQSHACFNLIVFYATAAAAVFFHNWQTNIFLFFSLQFWYGDAVCSRFKFAREYTHLHIPSRHCHSAICS